MSITEKEAPKPHSAYPERGRGRGSVAKALELTWRWTVEEEPVSLLNDKMQMWHSVGSPEDHLEDGWGWQAAANHHE